MVDRRGEKIGWTAGWLGGFLWVAVLSLMFLFQNRLIQGISGLVLTVTALVSIVCCAPWRHPSAPYWKLMIAPYLLFFAAAGWAVWAFGGIGKSGFNWWHLVWFVPVMLPFGILSRRRWSDPGGR